ncbi:hypothetical protein BASA81_001553 [Batrachochytrium salamandrivorans]|nr:hypothetical protein BASA81_001553 [Batrachochytrium salamandrivorans]
MSGNEEMVTPGQPKVVHRRDASYYSILHVINVLFESLLAFFCSQSNHSQLDEMYCHDSFTVGTGAVVSIVALVSGEAETSMLALQSLCSYHVLMFFAHVKRHLSEGVAPAYGKQVSVISVVNVVLMLQSLYFVVVVLDLVKWDFVLGAFAALLAMASPMTHVGWGAARAVPVLLMARRAYQTSCSSPASSQFGKLMAGGLLLSALADLVVSDVHLLVGLGLYVCAQIAYIVALTSECRELMLVTKAVPIFGYATMFFFVALLPRLDSWTLLPPVLLGVLLIAGLIWRASVLPNKSGLVFMLAAIALALAQTLLAIHQFASPIPNVRYPALALYFLGQGLFTQAVQARREEEPKPKDA